MSSVEPLKRPRIGKAFAPQKEAWLKVTGRAIYTHDFSLPDMLWGAVLRSPHPHARIVAIDTTRAEGMPGVRAVITSADAPDRYVHLGPRYADRYPLAHGRVRFVGEEVAAVAADTREQAQAAAAAIEVQYEVLPAVFEVERALSPSAPVLHQREGLPANVAQRTAATWGDVTGGDAHTAHTVHGTFSHGVVIPVCMETNAVVAAYDAVQQRLDMWAGTQSPYFARKEMAHILGLQTQQVRIHSIEIGGGFGGKSQAPEPLGIAALLSRKAGRPVKIVLSRQEEFLAGKTDHAKSMTLTTAVDAEGKILLRRNHYTVDNGAFTHMGPAYISAVRQRTSNLYRVGAVEFEGRLVYTNKVPGGSYRGMGAPQSIWALETQVDELAEQLGKDPLQYRIELANQSGDVTPQGFEISTCGLVECLREVGQRLGWDEKRRHRTPWRGVGIAAMINPSVGILYAEGNFANVRLELLANGRFLLATQNADCGTWQNTTLAQFVSETLDVDVSAIDVVHMDTDEAPDDLGSAASRVTFMAGAAAIDAANTLMAQVRESLGARLQVDPDSIACVNDGVRVPSGLMNWSEVAAALGPIRVNGHHKLTQPYPDPQTGYGNYSATYAFGAQGVEVEVDPETGRVTVLKVVSVQDVGRVINETSLDGQMHGGIVQGIGMALTEELVFDRGRPVNTSLINYRVPRIVESTQIETAYIETQDPRGPLGAKSSGEVSINPTVAAIANAVAHATGIRFRTLPITPHRVVAALARQRGRDLPLQPWRRPMNAEVALVRSLYPKGLFPAMKKLGETWGKPKAGPKAYEYKKASSLHEALALLDAPGQRVKLMAGGTDLLTGIRQGIYVPDRVVDIARLSNLGGIQILPEEGLVRLGAAVTLSELCEHEGLRQQLPALCEAAELIATQQIRNVATLAGDLSQEKRCWFFRSALPCYKNGGMACPCYAVTGDNRHHAILGAGRCAAPCVADMAPTLTALNATVVVRSVRGERRIGMEDFYVWSGETRVARDEIIVAVDVPLTAHSTQVYEKYALWRGDFPEASAGVMLSWQGDRLTGARISLGGVSPLPMRATHAERSLLNTGRRGELQDDAIREAAQKVVYGALPLRDNAAKVPMIVAVTERALRRARDARHRSPTGSTLP